PCRRPRLRTLPVARDARPLPAHGLRLGGVAEEGVSRALEDAPYGWRRRRARARPFRGPDPVVVVHRSVDGPRGDRRGRGGGGVSVRWRLPFAILVGLLVRVPFWVEALRTPVDADTAIIG